MVRKFPTSQIAGLIAFVLACQAFGASFEVRTPSRRELKSYALAPSHFKKCTRFQNILIAGSARVSDHAFAETAYQFDAILRRIDRAVAKRIRQRRILCILIAHDERTSDVPQFATRRTGRELDLYNWSRRGFILRRNGQFIVAIAEEHALQYEGVLHLASVVIHEFAHIVHRVGFDDALELQLKQAYERATASGKWMDARAAQRFRRVKSETPVVLFDALVKSFPAQPPELIRRCLDGGDILVNGKPASANVRVDKNDKVLIMFGGEKDCYALKNTLEYWAIGVQCWYNTSRANDHLHNHVRTRQQLIDYDPGLAALCQKVLGDDDTRFVSPRERSGQDHLATYDRNDGPKFKNSPNIDDAANDFFDQYWNDYWQRLHDKHLPKITE